MKAFDYQPTFKKTVLNNGVRIVTEHHPYSRACSAGIYVDLGSRDEPKDGFGSAHFVEHMVFKGTRQRTAMDIAKSLESVGGDLNAYTTHEFTCFHATCLREHLHYAVDVLADLVSGAVFDAADFDREREVILQEIDMSADDLEEFIFDLYFKEAYSGHALGHSILGTPESLSKISRKQLQDFYRERYHGPRMVVSVAGNVDHDDVVAWAERSLNVRRKKVAKRHRRKPSLNKFREIFKRSSEQTHLLMGLPSTSFKDSHRFEAFVVNALLGGGMTSRLYQKVREELGLAYSVYSYLHSFTDTGLLLLYAGTSEKFLAQVLDHFYKEVSKLKKSGVSGKDLDFFKTQVRGNILLGSDDIENRMNSLGVNEMVFGRYRSVDEIMEEIRKVSKDSVQEYIESNLDLDQASIAVIGDVDTASVRTLIESR
ncbi:MAG: insulinase family protein [Pseudobdellovibrionaceae bacterium]|nr:insulinase family protein [Bdellovibrionales bacterium]USN48738.1 MAG: insulinase family protein [Pseudobdellovibrionaceae bacterium]